MSDELDIETLIQVRVIRVPVGFGLEPGHVYDVERIKHREDGFRVSREYVVRHRGREFTLKAHEVELVYAKAFSLTAEQLRSYERRQEQKKATDELRGSW